MKIRRPALGVVVGAFAIYQICVGTNLQADSGAVSTTPGSKPLAISSATGALDKEMQGLNPQGQALLESKLSDLVKQVVASASRGDGPYVLNNIASQYREAGEKLVKALPQPGETIETSIVKDFNSYSILSIDTVTVEQNVAFVQAKIRYHKDALPEIIKEEKDNVADNVGDSDNLWASMGGYSSARMREKGGEGLATYYLVVQEGAWKIHSTFFSLNPMSQSDLTTVRDNMETLVR